MANSNEILDEQVCSEIDEKLDNLMNDVMDQHPEQSIIAEMFTCLTSFAAQIAAQSNTSEADFITTCREIYRQISGTTNPLVPRKLDPSLN